MAHSMGGAIYVIARQAMGFSSTLGFINPARVAAFLPMGLMLGAAVGAVSITGRGLVSGALGGLIAGAACGLLFDPLSMALGPISSGLTPVEPGVQAEVGAPGRAATAAGLGLLVGLFTALVERATRRAWVRLVLGRNEGREWPLDAAQTFIGRDERAHVPLFGDQNVAPLHAVIANVGGQYVLQDAGTPIGVGWNGQRVPQATLTHGDTIQVASHQLQFLMKGGRAASPFEGRVPAQPVAPAAPVPQPFVAPATIAPAASRTWSLVAMAGPMQGARFPVAGQIEAGREGHGLPMPGDAQASRRHASITPQGDHLALQDLGSTNGTFVNGARVQTAALKHGDTLQIGGSTFRVEAS